MLGAQLYASKCQSCHQANGSGAAVPGATSIPALWGAQSYSVGASMARVERAASFIAHNMPLGLAGTLTTQEAFDIAAYVNSHPRPDLPRKEFDWPAGGAPADLPYSTNSGHTAVESAARYCHARFQHAHSCHRPPAAGADTLNHEAFVNDSEDLTSKPSQKLSRRQNA